MHISKLVRSLAFAGLGVAVLSSGIALSSAEAADPIATRKAAMKNVGKATGMSAAMVKGEAEFDARVAELALRTMNSVALTYGGLFPEGSDSGGKTTASPKIWEDNAGFMEAVAKFEADTAAAIASPPADLDAFKGAFGKVAANCKSCHEGFRVKKN